MTQVSNKGCTLFEGSREGVESRLRGGCLRAPKKEASRETLWCTLFEGMNVEQMVYTLIESSREGVEPRLRGDCSRAPEKETSRETLWAN